MFNPLDMLQGPGAAGMQGVAQQFGLSPEQTRRALEALLPAFAIGLQRMGSNDPTGFANLFGQPMLTQAVLQQASMASGVGAQVLRQMLPMMAGAVVASIVHMLLNPPAAPSPAREPAQPPQAAAGFPINQAWIEMMKAFLPPAEAPAAQPARPATRGTRTEARPQGARAGHTGPADPKAAGQDLLQQLLQTGAEVQQQNVRAMQSLFDAFWSEGARATAAQQAAAKPEAAGSTPPKPAGRTPPRTGSA
ncbi:DUF937 domain-containing protein [Methylobacterium radiodurans]|uniref:DUF937 domain-containing protein n=1 Tax=Methylobacterium radiodurans TaxID=2202828 RepID=A0A2U8VMH8_9HYPH|nr:DUF937 domain-containing protein [Methylobacterium radiodurans]AWN34889.1 hypothetical protein DK427_03320 [Methylobacterium radiodurans]